MTLELVRGIPFNLHPPGEAVSDAIRRTGDFFEAEILDYLRDYFPEHGTILDIGANIGNHSIYFANFLKYRQILAFEPIPANYILLTENCAFYNAFYPFKFGITDKEKLLRIEPNISNMGASEVRLDGSVEVIGIPLDLLSLYDVTLLKIDVEWHEPEVISGAANLIRKNKPLILIEDVRNEYGGLLTDYKLIKGWPEHRTYLWGTV